MKRITILCLLLLATLQVWADNAPEEKGKKSTPLVANYKYQVVVTSQDDSEVIIRNNMMIDNMQNGQKRGWSDLGKSIEKAYKSAFTQKTVNATSNIISLGVNYATTLMQKTSKDFESWSKMKFQQCTYSKELSSHETIDDFYYRTSVNGALDPRDLKFNGFVCKNFIEVQQPVSANSPRLGHDVFYVSCKLRTDSLGISHLTNHSKFMLEVDSLVFYPKYCNIPNVTPRKADDSYNFDACTNLEFEMRVKVFSSWINEAIMITSDYQLGEFVIRARINKDALTVVGNDSLFIYNAKDPKTKDLVSIVGESFIVPRSYVGTANEPLWGTGQYKLAINVTETCQLDAKYYIAPEHYIKIEEVGNGRAVNFASLPGYKMWNKAVWKEEWRTMKARKSSDSFMTNVWKEIKTAYIGTNWVKELVDPAVTQILMYETNELKDLFDLNAPGGR